VRIACSIRLQRLELSAFDGSAQGGSLRLRTVVGVLGFLEDMRCLQRLCRLKSYRRGQIRAGGRGAAGRRQERLVPPVGGGACLRQCQCCCPTGGSSRVTLSQHLSFPNWLLMTKRVGILGKTVLEGAERTHRCHNFIEPFIFFRVGKCAAHMSQTHHIILQLIVSSVYQPLPKKPCWRTPR
jgi:hypothetical protein